MKQDLPSGNRWKISLLDYSLVFLTIFISDDSLLFGHTSSSGMIVTKIITNLLLLTCVFRVRIKQGPALAVWLLFLFMSLLSMISNFDFDFRYGYLMLMITLGFFFTQRMNFEIYCRAFSKIILLFTMIAIIYSCMITMFPNILYFLPKVQNANGWSASTILLASSYEGLESRAMSFFREPGVFAQYLALSIVFEFVFCRDGKLWHMLIYILGMVFSFSSAGFIYMILLSTIYIIVTLRETKKLSDIRIWIILFSLFVALMVVLFDENIYRSMVERNFGESQWEYNPRKIAQWTSLYIWWQQSPITGVGISHFLPIFQELSWTHFGILLQEGDATSTIFNGLARYGILWLFTVCGLFCLSLRLGHRQWVVSILCFGLFLGICMAQNMPYDILFWLLVFWGFQSEDVKRIQEKQGQDAMLKQ